MKRQNPETQAGALPTYESMAQCSGATDIPLAVLKRAKDSGCPAFLSGNRLNLRAFLGWWFTQQGIDDQVDLVEEQAKLARQKRIKMEREEEIAAGLLFPMAELEPWLAEHYIAPMSAILSAAPASLDTRCNPADPILARRTLKQWIEDTVKPALKAELQKPKQ